MTNQTSLERHALRIIRKHTHDRPISRKALVGALQAVGELRGLSPDYADRKARQVIQDLRTNHPVGARIVSTSRGAGYFFATSAEEIEECMAEEESRIASLSQKLVNMRRAADRLRVQPMEQGRLL